MNGVAGARGERELEIVRPREGGLAALDEPAQLREARVVQTEGAGPRAVEGDLLGAAALAARPRPDEHVLAARGALEDAPRAIEAVALGCLAVTVRPDDVETRLHQHPLPELDGGNAQAGGLVTELQRADGRLLTLPEWLYDPSERAARKRHSFSTWKHYEADFPLVPSGLIGPVKLEWFQQVRIDLDLCPDPNQK